MNVTCREIVCKYEEHSRWKYVTKEDVSFRLYDIGALQFVKREYYFGNKLLAKLERGTLTIFKGYAWNGMTCWKDDKLTMIPSLFHDFCYQLGDIFFTREFADEAFTQLLEARDHKLTIAFGLAVRACGWMFYGKESHKITEL